MEQEIPPSNVGGTAQDQLENNLELQAEIKNVIISKLMSNNPNLAKAIAYRSKYPHLFGSGISRHFMTNIVMVPIKKN